MRETYKKLYQILSPRDRRLVMLLFLMMLASAVMETVGIASILPFIAVLANRDFVQTNVYLSGVFEYLGFTSTDSFLVFLGIAFFLLFLGGLLMRALAFWAQAKFSNSRMCSISSRVFFGYLCKDYEWFLDRHTARLATTVLSEVDRTIEKALFPALQLIAHVMVIALLLLLLFLVDPFLASSMIIVLGGSYLGIYLALQGRVGRLGQVIFASNRGRYRATQEAFGGIKDLKMKALEVGFLERFGNQTRKFAKARVSEQLIGQMPSYMMQGVIFGGMLLVILYLMTVYEDFDRALPILAMYAIAGYRLMPSLQNGYRHLITLRNARPVLDSLHADLQSIGETQAVKASLQVSTEPLPVRREIRLREVRYRYPTGERDALQDISLVIPQFSTVAFVGPTGCGKTTLVDTILGLLHPGSGAVEVDGEAITPANVRRWQRNIGYVPQDIYLADASIAANIAYGLPEKRIDRKAVEKAAQIARLDEFVTTELKDGYDTEVGERGVRLSGGQKQRIGIARALYHDPEVLVLDEATSALDNLTEHAVMDAVRGLAKQKTIIMIAHRLTTVQACDTIFLLEAGRVVAQGSYEELVEHEERFRQMAGVATAVGG
jgi:ATP-binding cassette, subfamily B, bacterial PglK